MEPAEAVLRFLESLGRRTEADFYLSLFRAEPKERFAAISVDANVARSATEAVRNGVPQAVITNLAGIQEDSGTGIVGTK